jgi:hypothetical protein
MCIYWHDTAQAEEHMAQTAGRKRKSLEERTLKRAKKAQGVSTHAEVVRLSLERGAEMEEFWRFMKQSRRILKPGIIKCP